MDVGEGRRDALVFQFPSDRSAWKHVQSANTQHQMCTV